MDDLKLYAGNEKSLESLIQTVFVFSNDIGMEFRVKKCAVLIMKKGMMANSDRIALHNKTMKGLKEGDSYWNIGVIQAAGIKHQEMKEKVKTVLKTSQKDTGNEIEWWKYNNRNKYMSNFITKILHCLSRLDRGRISANGQVNKKIIDNALGIES